LLVRSPRVPDGAHVRDVGILRVHGDALDALGVVQTEMRARAYGVARAIDAVAERRAVARIAFPGADPQHVLVRRRDLDRADRRNRLAVEDRRERRAAVRGLDDAAGGARDVERLGLSW